MTRGFLSPRIHCTVRPHVRLQVANPCHGQELPLECLGCLSILLDEPNRSQNQWTNQAKRTLGYPNRNMSRWAKQARAKQQATTPWPQPLDELSRAEWLKQANPTEQRVANPQPMPLQRQR